MGKNRYYNPPDEVRTIGRSLGPDTYPKLRAKLRPDEVLIAMFTNQAPALVAARCHHKTGGTSWSASGPRANSTRFRARRRRRASWRKCRRTRRSD